MDVKEYNKRYYEKHKEKLIQHNKEYWAAKAKAYRVPELDYEIVDGPLRLKLNGKTKFARLIIRRKQQ